MAAAPAPGPDRIDPKVLKTALILVVGFLAVIFDTTIVSVALHTLAVQLHAPVSTIQWVTTGYLLALGIAVPLSTWGLRRFGGKRLWMAALAVFLIGSVGASLAWNVDSLIAWRVVQGAGGGIMFPLLTTLVMQAAGGKALGRTVTIVALPALLGPVLGPLVGGAILTHLDWRFMFWVNVPFCVAGLILAARYLPADKLPGRPEAAPRPARPRPAHPRRRRGHPRAEQRGQQRRLRAPRCPRAARHRRRAHRRVHRLRAAARQAERAAARRRQPACPPPGGLGVRGALLLRVLPVRRHAAAAALLPGGTRRLRADRRAHARPAGRRHAAVPRPGRAAHRQDRRPPDRRRRLRHRRRRDRPLRLRRAGYERVAARALAGHPRLRPRCRHHPGDGRRVHSASTRRRSPTRAWSPG